MRQSIFIIAILITIKLEVSAQPYYPFPTDSVTWSVEFYNDIFPDPTCIARHYGLVGDTIIDSKTYSKLYGHNQPDDYPFEDTAFNSQTATYLAAVREDSNKKVWIRQPAETADILYYDFALDSGDTFCFEYFGTFCGPVSSVDSILIDGNYRRQIHFEAFKPETWIEGIGSTTGWFEYQWTGTFSWQLLCYSENQNHLYDPSGIGNIYCHCDTYFTGLDRLTTYQETVKVYPIPSYGNIILEFENELGTNYKLQIFDQSGRPVFVKSDIVIGGIIIDGSRLAKGLYFFQLSDDYAIFESGKLEIW